MSVKHMILASLQNGSLHGYELGRRLSLIFGSGWDVKPGQIASTLNRLEEAGWVTCETRKSDGAPDRKEYQLTSEGLNELERWYLHPEVRPYLVGDTFYHKLVLSLLDAPVSPEAVLDAQRRELYQELRDVMEVKNTTRTTNNLPALLLIDAAIAHLEADIRWIERLSESLSELKTYQPPLPVAGRRGRPPKQDLLEEHNHGE